MISSSKDDAPTPRPDLRCRPGGRRGGRRPGAGAKPGNLNALKHGRRSAQFAQLGFLLATIPETRHALLHLAGRHRLKQRKAEQVAARLLEAMIERARAIAERQTINDTARQNSAPQVRLPPRKTPAADEPSNPTHNSHRTIDSIDTEIPVDRS